MARIVSLSLILFFCGCPATTIHNRDHDNRDLGRNTDQRNSEPIEKIRSVRNSDGDEIEVEYYYQNTLHYRYTHYLPNSEFYENYGSCLWLRCAPSYSASVRPVIFCVDRSGNMGDIIITAVSRGNNLHRVYFSCLLNENRELCARAQEDFELISDYFDIQRRVEEAE